VVGRSCCLCPGLLRHGTGIRALIDAGAVADPPTLEVVAGQLELAAAVPLDTALLIQSVETTLPSLVDHIVAVRCGSETMATGHQLGCCGCDQLAFGMVHHSSVCGDGIRLVLGPLMGVGLRVYCPLSAFSSAMVQLSIAWRAKRP
jgi:hypothetical protein